MKKFGAKGLLAINLSITYTYKRWLNGFVPDVLKMIEDEGKFEVETSKSVEMLKRPLRYSTFAEREQAEGNNLKGGGGHRGRS